MRKYSLLFASLLLTVMFTPFQSCIKEKCTQYYTYWVPVYKTAAEVRTNIKSNAPREIERPGKIYVRGNYIFLNEIDKGIHVIDNSNPRSPQRIAFIDIPGNMDMAVKGDILYADMYTDLVTIDIANPLQASLKKVTETVFPERGYYTYGGANNNGNIIVDWIRRDTVVEGPCGGSKKFFGGVEYRYDDVMALFSSMVNLGSTMNSASSSSPFGMGGSMARFTIVNDYLYAVSHSDLKVLSIQNPVNPVFNNATQIGFNIETIYPFNNRLFIGSQNGVFIYDLANPAVPSRLGQFGHTRSCDPVIADNNYAYVTLRSGNVCAGYTNQLDVLDISSLANPALVKTYPMTNPHGLSKDGNVLIVCDGTDGLKFFDATAPGSNTMALRKSIPGMETYDVIAYSGWALVIAKDGLYQYQFDNNFNVSQLSRMPVKQ